MKVVRSGYFHEEAADEPIDPAISMEDTINDKFEAFLFLPLWAMSDSPPVTAVICERIGLYAEAHKKFA